eukprot:Lankesteria_metandrocarpae@DN1798_c0_g1_i1.p1
MGGSASKNSFAPLLEQLNQSMSSVAVNDEEEFWRNFLGAAITSAEITEGIRPHDIRLLKTEQKSLCSALFKGIVLCMKRCVDETVQRADLSISADDSRSLLTCVRLLTRLMPAMLEDPNNEFVKVLFWRSGGYVPIVQQTFKMQNHSEIQEVHQQPPHTDPHPTNSTGTRTTGAGTAPQSGRTAATANMTLAVEMLTALQRLLFLKGFTCPPSDIVIKPGDNMPCHKIDTRFVWQGGVGAARDLAVPNVSSQILKNRSEVLRCLLVCFSGSLFQSIDEYQLSHPVWLRVFTNGDLPYTANVFSSLLSYVLAFQPTGRVFSASSEATELVQLCLQVLVVVFDYDPSLFVHRKSQSTRHHGNSQSYERNHNRSREDASAASGVASSTSLSSTASSSLRNVYRTMLSSIKKETEVQFLFDGTVRLLQPVLRSKGWFASASPSSSAKAHQHPTYFQELLLVLWHVSTTNPSYLRQVAASADTNKLLIPILFLLLEASHARVSDSVGNPLAGGAAVEHGPSRVGILHMCSFILLVLSSEREYCVRLNEPFLGKFPLNVPIFQGTHVDLLILVINGVVVNSTSSSSSDSLIDMLLTVLCNVSAYARVLCLESCVKLLALVKRFSHPGWLFSAPYHYHDVFFLLDVFNNIIQYQYVGNTRLIYSILRQSELFVALENMSFPYDYIAKKRLTNANSNDDETNTVMHHTMSTASTTAVSAESVRQSGKQGSPSQSGMESQKMDVESENVRRSIESTSADVSGRSGKRTVGLQSPPQESTQGVLRGGDWRPTEEWFSDWKAKLPLHTIMRLNHCLLPKVEKECYEKDLIDQAQVLSFLERTTLVGLLPVPHPIIIRNYQPNAYTSLWFTSYMWGLLFSQSQSSLTFDWRKIKLIVINNHDTAAMSNDDTIRTTQKGNVVALGTADAGTTTASHFNTPQHVQRQPSVGEQIATV